MEIDRLLEKIREKARLNKEKGLVLCDRCFGYYNPIDGCRYCKVVTTPYHPGLSHKPHVPKFTVDIPPNQPAKQPSIPTTITYPKMVWS